MLGDFLKDFEEGCVKKLTLQEVKELAPGTAVVALKDPSELSNGGLPTDIRFGIRAEEEDVIILQNPLSDDWDNPYFQITAFDIDFLQMQFYLYGEQKNKDLSATLNRAKERLYTDIEVLRSKAGDDFVDECITGLSVVDIFAQYDISSGQHWWTPLIVDTKFIIEQARAALDSAIAEKKQQGEATVTLETSSYLLSHLPASKKPIALPEVEHHGILIERARVIHFSEGRIRTNGFGKFLETTPNSAPGGPAAGEKEQIELAGRLYTRNRAVWVFCTEGVKGRYWGTYNLLTNNCEHFSRACRENRRVSAQVINQTIDAINTILSNILPLIGALVVGVISILQKLFMPPIIVGPIENRCVNYEELKRIFDNA